MNDKAHHYQGAKAGPYCKLPHLASTLHFSRGSQQQAHRKMLTSTYQPLISPWSISARKALVHFELKLSLYVCQPKLHMQCIEILSRAIPRLLAVRNAMPPNRNMPAYLQKWKMFFDLLNRNNSISLGFRRNWLLPRSKQCLSFRNTHRKHISIRKPALPKSL